MAAEMVIGRTEFYVFLFFIFLAILFGIVLLLMVLWTPALTFFKARLKKIPIIRLMNRAGMSKYMLMTDVWKGTGDVKKIGTFQLSDKSGMTDVKSGVKVFDGFSEFGATIPENYAPIVQELRTAGLVINSWNDYKFYLDLVNPLTTENILAKAKDEKDKARLIDIRTKLREHKINIKPFQTYKMADLVQMFPNNVRPEFIEARVIYKVASKIKAMKLDRQWLLILGVFLIIATICLIIILKFAKTPDCPAVICTMQEIGGIVKATAQNMTI
jgi:hypothetical protein